MDDVTTPPVPSTSMEATALPAVGITSGYGGNRPSRFGCWSNEESAGPAAAKLVTSFPIAVATQGRASFAFRVSRSAALNVFRHRAAGTTASAWPLGAVAIGPESGNAAGSPTHGPDTTSGPRRCSSGRA